MAHEYSFEQDLQEAEAMTGSLESYLTGDDLYGSVGGGLFGSRQMPSLTVGALEMRLRRLNELRMQLDPEQRERLAAVTDRRDAIRNEWRLHYEKKLLREANSRLDSLGHYFQDVAQNMDSAAATYRPEQLKRTIVEEIRRVMDALNITSEEIDQKVRFVDNRLQGIALEHTDFLWASELEPAYPKKDFWWLYRQPRDGRA